MSTSSSTTVSADLATDHAHLCIDANVVVHALGTQAAPELAARIVAWTRAGRVFAVPSLWRYEVTNGLYRSANGGVVEPSQLPRILAAFWELPIVYHDEVDLHERAAAIALALRSGAAYDAHYLALSERLSIPFYTCDARLYNAARHRFPLVELVPIA